MAETIAVVFTDLVDSTRLLSALGDDAFDALRRDHFAVLRGAIAEHGGTEVKNLGDGLMAVFDSASDAIAAAVAMQVDNDRRGRRTGATAVGLKVGASIGDATTEDGDWFGTPVVEAARLCAACGPGDLLITDVMRLLAGSRVAGRVEPLGERELKGLPEPVAVCAVRWEAVDADEDVPLPSVLAAAAQLPFAGRAGALAEVRAAQAAAVGGSARTVFVAGEPGIGKTRLTAQVCADLHADGSVVLFGRSEDAIDVPFRPFTEVLDRLVRHAPDDLVADHLDAVGAALFTLVPALEERASGAVVDHAPADSDAQRLRLFHAVADLLRRQSEVAPLVVVLDDVHWADQSSLLLLRHLVSALDDARLLVLATYRDTDLDRRHPLAAILADFRRVPTVERISLDGLSPAEVVEYLAIAGGHDLAPEGVELGRQLAEITDGNPFFLTETLRHLAEEGAIVERDGRWVAGDVTPDEVGVPEGIREVVGRRLSALDDATEDLLQVAAVVGAHFDTATVAAVAGLPEDEVVDRLDVACERALTAEDADRFGWYRFAHALVRQTLLEELSSTKRIRLHRAIAEQLEAHAPERVEELAHHYLEAAPAGVGERAVEVAARAGNQALERSAPEQALRWFERALEVEDGLSPDPVRRCELLLEVGLARNWMQQPVEGGPALLEAAELARQAGRPDLLATAAYRYLGNYGAWVDMGDPHRGPLIEEALAGLPPGEHPELRLRLLQRKWGEHQLDPDPTVGNQIAIDVLALARQVDDPVAKWEGLIACAGLYQFRPDLDVMEDLIAEALAVEGIGALRAAETIGLFRCGMHLARGEFAAAAADAAHYREAVARVGAGIPMVVEGVPASLAAIAGRFDDARAGFDHLLATGTTHLDVLSAVGGGQWIDLFRGTGDRLCAELEALPDATLVFADAYPGWAVAHLLRGAEAEARAAWEEWRPMIDVIPHFARSHLATWATYPAWRFGDAAISEWTIDVLRPFSGQWPTPNVEACNGPADLHIGIGLLALGRADEAEPLLRASVADADVKGAPVWATYGRLFHALALRSLGREDEAAAVAARCATEASGFGMRQVLVDLDREGLVPSAAALG